MRHTLVASRKQFGCTVSQTSISFALPLAPESDMTKQRLTILAGYALAGGVAGIGLAAFATVEDHEQLGPLPESMAACEELDEGAECRVQFRGDSVRGECMWARQVDEMLMCIPQGEYTTPGSPVR
jgi:hypothetical protein